MFNCYDSIRINCPYFNNDVNGKKKGICSWEDTKPISISNLLDDITK